MWKFLLVSCICMLILNEAYFVKTTAEGCLGVDKQCNIKDNSCCAGLYCNKGGIVYPNSCRKCTAKLGTCGGKSVTRQCCGDSSCQSNGKAKPSTCKPGQCSTLGDSCNKPCCATLECGTWQGNKVCRPFAPSCFKNAEKGHCPNSGVACCGRKCKPSEPGPAVGAAPPPLISLCECSSKDLPCIKNGDCCSGLLCNIQYQCQ